MYSRVSSIEIDFINGYLTPIAMMMDYVTQEVGFDYYFHPMGNEVLRSDLAETVRGMLERSFLGYKDQRGGLYYQPERIDDLLNDSYSLSRFDDWEANLGGRILQWFGKPFVGQLKSAGSWPTSFLVDDFVKVLRQFFGDAATECWIIEGVIKEELYVHWGGCCYDDFFFDSNGQFYQLHFDLCD